MVKLKKKKGIKKEIAIKAKYGIFWIMVAIAIIVLFSGIGFYKIRDKISFYESISKEVNENDITTCTDEMCVIEKVSSSTVTEEDCDKTPYKETCKNILAEKEAIQTGDGSKCAQITNKNRRDNCYLSLAIIEKDSAYCESITDSIAKKMCLDMFNK